MDHQERRNLMKTLEHGKQAPPQGKQVLPDCRSARRCNMIRKLFHALTAGDVMNRAGAILPRGMSMATAARFLLEDRARVAPVTDGPGRCVGVLSAADCLRWAAGGRKADDEAGAPADCVWCDWQVVDEPAPRDEVRQYMTRDPLLVRAETPLGEFADALLDPRPRPVIVVDEQRRPLGVVSSQGILATLASPDHRPAAGHPTSKRRETDGSIVPGGEEHAVTAHHAARHERAALRR
jgi:CBS domain-containing protein